MFRVKICGITSVDDARIVVSAGADAIGLNFYSGSKRYCAADTALQIVAALPPGVCKVGVFVNASGDEIRETARRLSLNLAQLHGDEPPELLRELRPLPVMRAFRVGADLSAVDEYLRACHTLRCLPRMVLVDAAQSGQFGGTGVTLDWRALAAGRRHLRELPLVLAGGLNPSNVAGAIAEVRPWAVDTASGVESAPGKKSDSLVREFVASARDALARAAVKR
jgi:phosphoribosylanthranilate isomerase